MSTPSGDIKISANFEVNVGKPADPRVTATTIVNRNNITFKYKGMQVYVEETSSSYTLQNDLVTWTLNGTPTQGPNVFYVAKQYTGAAIATIGGLTLASITSSNTTYNTQLAKATIGSTFNPYPDPWSARNAALDAITAGTLTKAEVVVLSGDWTVGSDDITKNGDAAGVTPNSSVAADIQITAANANTTISSLYQNNLTFTMSKSCTVTYINSTYAIPLCYVSDITDQLFESSIVGGKWIQVYGEQSGFTGVFMSLDNANGKFNFQPSYISTQQVFAFKLLNYKRMHITMDACDLPDSDFITPYSTREGDGTESSLYVKIDQCRFGHGVIAYPDNVDFWYFMSPQAQSTARKKLISIYVGELFLNCGVSAFLFFGQGDNVLRQNVTISVHVENLYHTDSNTGPGTTTVGDSGGNYALICTQGSSRAINRDISVSVIIDNAVTQLPLFSTVDSFSTIAGSMNNRFRYHCGYHKRTPATVTGRKKSNIYLYGQQTANAGLPSKYIISGVYVNTEAECVVAESNGIYDTHVQLSGRYETTGAAKPCMAFNMAADKKIVLENILCTNDGSVYAIDNVQATDSNFAGIQVASRSILWGDVTMTGPSQYMPSGFSITGVWRAAPLITDVNNYA